MAVDQPVVDLSIPVQTSNDAKGDTTKSEPAEPTSILRNEGQLQADNSQPKEETMTVGSPTKDYEQPPTPG